jgi:D-serine deaminase-like pyridoxal phosphate-dependent protein
MISSGQQVNYLHQPISVLDTPALLLDLDGIDANLKTMFDAGERYGVHVRVHFKSLKSTGLARYIADRGANGFLCAKLSEAEILADAGFNDVMIANQIVGNIKLTRLAELASRISLRVCVDNADNVHQLAHSVSAKGARLGVLIEVDVGMRRCGVQSSQQTLELAKQIISYPSLKFVGLQGYDGHLQLITDISERRAKCLEGLAKLIEMKKLLQDSGIPISVVTGGGTGTWEFVASYPGITEIQPGSFVLMDSIYHTVRPEFQRTLSILTTVVSRREGQYVLDAGSKAISQDFGKPLIKNRPEDKVTRLPEEHCLVESSDSRIQIGDRFEVFPAHCCATMNLHRVCYGIRHGLVEAVWPIEASGRYD